MSGGERLGLAVQPTLHQYFFFLVNSKDKLIIHTIDEAQGLWDSLHKIYDFQGSLPEIEVTLKKKISEGLLRDSFIYLGALNNSDGTVNAQQIFFNNTLIFLITLTTPKNFETDVPEKTWEQQLEIEITTQDLKNALGLATVLHSKSSLIEEVLMKVRINLQLAKDQTVNYSTFNFCQMFQFGNISKYLLLTEPGRSNEEMYKKFIEYDFPYILAITFRLDKIYKNFKNVKSQLISIDEQIKQHLLGLPMLEYEIDTIMLAIRKDHVEDFYKDASKLKSNIKKYADKFDYELIKIRTMIKKIGLINDDIFKKYLTKFENYFKKMDQWVFEGEKIFKEIFNGYEKYTKALSQLLEQFEKDSKKGLGLDTKPKIYTSPKAKSETISIEGAPYKSIREDYVKPEDIKPEIFDKLPLEWCSCYHLIENQPSRSIEIFSDLVKGRGKFMGLWITQIQKENFQTKFKLNDIYGFQLNTEEGEEFLPPILSRISHSINEFLSTNIHSIIYFEGFDFLLKFNDQKRILTFSNNIKDSIVLNDSILILSLNDSIAKNNNLKSIMENSIEITNSDVSLDDLY